MLLWQIIISALIGTCVAAGLVIGVEELLWLRRARRLDGSRVAEMLRSLSPLPINIFVSIAMMGWWSVFYRQAQSWAVMPLPLNAASIVCAFFLVDLSYYWEHRCAHRLTWLWGLYHAIHHSSRDYTIATAYRVSCINQMLSPAFYLPWILLGFHPLLIVGWQLVAFHYQAWLHTEMIGSLGIFDRWFNTPANHRLHHSAAIEHRDRNLGAVTMLWDRLFGTYLAADEQLVYGIPDFKVPTNALGLYIDPWRRWLLQR
jgi:sterol desaturase/sphingolipid hydroxylase (fatty acid hydroxylase superfamily)